MVRMFILRDQGGVYFDANVIMLESTDWILDIAQNPYVTNQFG